MQVWASVIERGFSRYPRDLRPVNRHRAKSPLRLRPRVRRPLPPVLLINAPLPLIDATTTIALSPRPMPHNPRGNQSLDPPGRSTSFHITMPDQVFQALRHRSLVNRLRSPQEQARLDIQAANILFLAPK